MDTMAEPHENQMRPDFRGLLRQAVRTVLTFILGGF
jgi:hypothetical protein